MSYRPEQSPKEHSPALHSALLLWYNIFCSAIVRFVSVEIEKHTDIHGRGGDIPPSVKLKNVVSLVGGGVLTNSYE